jgi:hypothetical protein
MSKVQQEIKVLVDRPSIQIKVIKCSTVNK